MQSSHLLPIHHLRTRQSSHLLPIHHLRTRQTSFSGISDSTIFWWSRTFWLLKSLRGSRPFGCWRVSWEAEFCPNHPCQPQKWERETWHLPLHPSQTSPVLQRVLTRWALEQLLSLDHVNKIISEMQLVIFLIVWWREITSNLGIVHYWTISDSCHWTCPTCKATH